MDNAEAREWLDAKWAKAVAENAMTPDERIDALANSKTVSIRYALVTQILGKIADPLRNLLTLQLAASSAGAWDARSFATAVVVPWVADNQHILGTSPDPYVSKPLRRERLERSMPNVRDKHGWTQLVELLNELEASDYPALVDAFQRVLRALVRRLAVQTFGYAIPQRISLPAMSALLTDFLSTPSSGLRPLVAATALLRTIGTAFGLFSRVEGQGINEADAAGGAPGDVLCYCHDNPGRLCLVVEVKDIELTLAHVQSSTRKAKQADLGLTNLLFAVPAVRLSDREAITALTRKEWVEGLNVYTAGIVPLMEAAFMLLGDRWRIDLIRAIGAELDERQDQAARRSWHDSLLNLSRLEA